NLSGYFEGGIGDLDGTYTFAGTYPDCTVTQSACP
ncbi:unnamed protein product, partial [marine sediment metagenome]